MVVTSYLLFVPTFWEVVTRIADVAEVVAMNVITGHADVAVVVVGIVLARHANVVA